MTTHTPNTPTDHAPTAQPCPSCSPKKASPPPIRKVAVPVGMGRVKVIEKVGGFTV
jgi:hypothetical protein